MTDFGDFTDDDAFDTEPADPEQAARKFHAIWLEHEPGGPHWDELDLVQQTRRIAIVVVFLAWLRRSGALR